MVRHDEIHGNELTTGKWLERLKWKEVGNSVPLQTWINFEITQTLDGDGKVCVKYKFEKTQQSFIIVLVQSPFGWNRVLVRRKQKSTKA